MFSNLMASAPKSRSLASVSAWGFATVWHALFVLAAVWMTGRAAEIPSRTHDQVIYLDLMQSPQQPLEKRPEEPPPAPPAQPDLAPVEVTRPDLPKGFQELSASEEILAGIPAPGLIEIKAEDFSGLGIAGGVAGGRPLLPSDTARVAQEFVPPPVSVAVVDEPPRILNANQASSRMQELYPAEFRMTDTKGQVMIQLVVDTHGRVESDGLTIVSTTDPQFEAPTRELVRLLRWEPAKRNGRPVRVWVRLPVSWTIE